MHTSYSRKRGFLSAVSMGKSKEIPSKEVKQAEEEEADAEEEKSFEELGLDLRLVHALNKKGIQKPTLIQQASIPLILVSSFLQLAFFSVISVSGRVFQCCKFNQTYI